MEEMNEKQPNQTAAPPQFDMNAFFQIPEVQKAVPELIKLLGIKIDVNDRAKGRDRINFLWITIVLFLIVTMLILVLALNNKISSEGVAFLLGVIVTGAIAIIRDFTGSDTE